ncbi:MAG: ATP-binding protein [Planctomycetota bacterium]
MTASHPSGHNSFTIVAYFMVNVLLVEDSDSVAALFRFVIEKQAHRVTWYKTGASALNAGRGPGWDVVFLDYGLPDTTGVALLEKLRTGALHPGTPVCFLTAVGDSQSLDDIDSSSADKVLFKPCDPQALIDFIDESVARANASQRRDADSAKPPTESRSRLQESPPPYGDDDDWRFEVSLTLNAKTAHLEYIDNILTMTLLKATGMQANSDYIYGIRLAVSEAVTNIIEHSGHPVNEPIRLTFRSTDSAIEIEITDRGGAFDLDNAPAPNMDNYQGSGLGIFLIKQTMNDATRRRTADGQNVLTLTRRRPTNAVRAALSDR